MYTRNANNSAVIEPAINLSEQRDEDGPHRTLLWAIVGQAVEDASYIGWCVPNDCPYAKNCRRLKQQQRDWNYGTSPDEAMGQLRFMLGGGHAIVRRVEELRKAGIQVHVNLHYQDVQGRENIFGVGRE